MKKEKPMGDILSVEMVALSDLVAYKNNSRLHSDEQIAQIAASITEFGFTNPLIINADGQIIAGHGRAAAAETLNIKVVPAIRLKHLSLEQQRALVIADNRIAENAIWDEELLRSELESLSKVNFSFEAVGFSDEQLASILDKANASDEPSSVNDDPDAVPEPLSTVVSRHGDIWVLGDHRVMCGSATDQTDVMRLMGDGELADCVWTDPPYNVAYNGAAGSIKNDDMSDAKFLQFLTDAFSCAIEVTRAGGACYVSHSEHEGFNFRAAFRAAGYKLSGCLIWVKPSLVLGRSDYQWRHEPILYGWKPGAAHYWKGGRSQTTVIDEDVPSVRVTEDGKLHIDVGDQLIEISGEKLSVEAVDGSILRCAKPQRNIEHPTMKPVSLIERMLKNSSNRGDRVLDPFGGSGSTLIACEEMGRVAFLMELEPKFVDVIVRRWQIATGKHAYHLETEESFDQKLTTCLDSNGAAA